MTVPVACDLVTPPPDLPDERWHPLRQPSKDEERSLRFLIIQQIEDILGIPIDPQWILAPILFPDILLERSDMKIVLNVDRERVEYAR
jgi:hypothetical protein